MQLYAQWLHGAYFQLALSSSRGIREQQLFEQTAAILRLHALLGNRIVLSDVQVIDSPVILRLFADDSFRNFLRKHPHILELVAYPEKTTEPTRYSIATAGFRRALAPKWLSSTFPTPEATRELAERLLDAGEIDQERQLRDAASPLNQVIQRWPERALLLKGMFRAVAHFATSSDAPVAPPSHAGSPLTLHDMLRLTLKNPDVKDKHQQYLITTLDFIENSVEDPAEQGLQSVVFNTLDQKLSPLHPDYRTIKHTAHHAWNAAVECSVAPEGGSLGDLSLSTQVGFYLNEPIDTLAPLIIQRGGYSIRTLGKKAPIIIDSRICNLSWREVAQVVEETTESANKFQAALSSNREEDIRNAVNEHVKHLATSLVSKPPPIIPGFVWIIGPVVALLIDPGLGTLITGVKATEECLRDMLYRGRRYLVTDTLRKAALQARLRPASEADRE